MFIFIAYFTVPSEDHAELERHFLVGST